MIIYRLLINYAYIEFAFIDKQTYNQTYIFKYQISNSIRKNMKYTPSKCKEYWNLDHDQK